MKPPSPFVAFRPGGPPRLKLPAVYAELLTIFGAPVIRAEFADGSRLVSAIRCFDGRGDQNSIVWTDAGAIKLLPEVRAEMLLGATQ